MAKAWVLIFQSIVLMSALVAVEPAACVTVEGIAVADNVTVGGQKLVLNGAGHRKRSYFKTDVSAIYATQSFRSLEALNKLPGAKRIHLSVLKNISGSVTSRYFLNDFKLVATDAEFRQLVTEIGLIGSMYGGVSMVRKGDVVTCDWIPGKGMVVSLNGEAMLPAPDASAYINNELLFQIFLRIYAGSGVPDELRFNLLGLSQSMLDR